MNMEFPEAWAIIDSAIEKAEFTLLLKEVLPIPTPLISIKVDIVLLSA